MLETTPISISSQDLPLCSHRTRAGRRCQLPVLDTSSGLCFRHAGLRTPKKDPDDLSAELLDKLTEFHTPYEVNEFLAKLLLLLVRNRISAKRAGAHTEKAGAAMLCPYRGRTSTTIYAAFISFWRELLRELIGAEPHALAGIALCSRSVVN